MQCRGIEYEICNQYIQDSRPEVDLIKWLSNQDSPLDVVIFQGFEERSLGLLQILAKKQNRIETLIIHRYKAKKLHDPNRRLDNKVKDYIEKIRPNFCSFHEIDERVKLVDSLKGTSSETCVLDITGLSRYLLFSFLDQATELGREVFIAYTEPEKYWPQKDDYEKIINELSDKTPSEVAKVIDSQPWLYSWEHEIKTIDNHDGYDIAGYPRILIGFLTFKCARIASIVKDHVYSDYIFISGKPRLEENFWHNEARKKINESLINSWPVVEINTFGYRDTIRELTNILFGDKLVLERYNVSITPLGSKLQTVACWVISRICRSITFVTSAPKNYFEKAYSENLGESWVFPLLKPPL